MTDLAQNQTTTDSQSSVAVGFPGILVDGRFWHFKPEITSGTIAVRKAHGAVRRVIDIAIIALGIAGLLVFILGGALSLQEEIIKADTWWTPSPIIFGFWLAVLCAMFMFYRMLSRSTDSKKVPSLERDKLDEVTVIPSLDVVERHEDIAKVLTPGAFHTLEVAYGIASDAKHREVLPIHIFTSSLDSRSVRVLMVRLGISFEEMKGALQRRMQTVPTGDTEFGSAAREIVAKAFRRAAMYNQPKVTASALFAECYASDEFLQELLYSLNVEAEELENVVAWIRISEQLQNRQREFSRAASFKSTGTMNRSYTSIATPFLDRVSQDLTRAAASGHLPMLIGRESEMNQILRSIEGGRQSVVLVGPPGVGKDAIIDGIAARMVEERVPAILQDKRLVKLSVPHIVSVQGGAGAEERMLVTLSEVGRSGNIVVVIEDVDQLVGAGGVDLSSVVGSELEKGYTFVIGTTTPQGYTNAIERSILGQRLQKINIEEPNRNDAIQIIASRIGNIENKNSVIFTYEAVAGLVDLSGRYMHESYLPEKGLLLAEEVANMVGKRGQEWARVSKDDVAAIISEKTNIPVTEVTQEEGAKLLDLEKLMHERVIGQEEAVTAVASALRRARVELRAENRPIANFLFLGPTGVGKTETAKATAQVYFGNEQSMLRFDMSEYQDKASIARLIGGAGEGGQLTEAVRKNPFSLLLLDELEKAHPDILNLFLQVMDDGRLTDGAGRTIDFTNVIMIATSNAGTQYIQDSVAAGVDVEVIKQNLIEQELKQIYRPEFLNRFDGIMVFKPLSPEDVVSIGYLMIEKVRSRLEAKGISFEATDEAIHELAKKGYDPKFGARPLRRVIQETVDNAVAEFLLQGKVGRRDSLILEPGGKIRVEKAAAL
ncbi:MAG: ATP-dependent Clp protease ATP-binding subunit [Candidatus Uhrbacteria bacterium]|nr:ATP-dependent Clp protease ATP-binding subunit [Candidatus Uhrbacteria bacterium]